MLTNGFGRKRLLRVSALASAVLLVGCGGGDKKEIGTGQPSSSTIETTVPATTAITVSSTTSSPPTTGSRSAVSTSTTSPLADAAIGRDLLVEHTTYSTPDFRPLVMNGKSYVNALRMVSDRTPARAEINAGRSRKRFVGVLGIPDDQKSTSSHLVEISLDGGPAVYSVTVKFGEEKQIDLDVSNVLRIRITVSSTTSDSGYLAIGNPRFS